MSINHETSGDGYVVRNYEDWPAAICGSLTLADIFEVAKGVPELAIDANSSLTSYGEIDQSTAE